MKTTKHWKDIFSTIISEADVIFEILDARNPLGTRNYVLERFVQKNTPYKKIFLIINKIDLIPKIVLNQWLEYFRKEIEEEGIIEKKIFYVSARYNRGILFFKKQLRQLFAKTNIRIMIVGYPNTGKSSLISALAENRKKIGISSKAGYTRGVMDIKIGSGISLIDTPGVIPLSENNEVEQALKSIINPEKVKDKETVAYKIIDVYITPVKILNYFKIDEDFIKDKLDINAANKIISKYLKTPQSNDNQNILLKQKIKISQISADYSNVSDHINYEDFENIIKLIGYKRGILSHGGLINENQIYKMIIHAWQKNKIKYYVLPPSTSN